MRDCKNGKDNDCSGIIDAQEDGDKDGYAGCADCNDYNKFINPGALEIPGNFVDDNCNGVTDEAVAGCDVAGLDSNNANDWPKAIGICGGVVSSTFPVVASPTAKALLASFGPANPAPKPATMAVKGYLNCGLLARGFVRVRCDSCGQDQLVAFSCKQRGICPSCDAKRMTEGAAHLVESVLPGVPCRQFVLTVPFALRYVLAWNAELRSAVLHAFLRAVEAHYRKQAKAVGDLEATVKPHCGAVSVLQRFESSLRLAPHWHVIFADGVWLDPPDRDTEPRFLPAPPLRDGEVAGVLVDAVKRITRQVVRRGWTDRDEDPLQDRDPALAACLQGSLWNRPAKGGAATSAVAKVGVAPHPEPKPHGHNCATLDGFSLHANTRVGSAARKDLERLCRYLLRPGVPATRIAQTDDGKVRVTLKTPPPEGRHCGGRTAACGLHGAAGGADPFATARVAAVSGFPR
jgi:ribosomal protein S27E